ncbi:MAG TPA: hypothetical protein VF145_13700 [Chitinophagaceae bacterium]
MRKLFVAILLLLLLAAGSFMIVRLVVSKGAPAFMPVKWQLVPLGEKPAVVYHYLGAPLSRNGRTSHWEARLHRRKKYTLDVRFNDSVAVYYRVRYMARFAGIGFEQTVAADSIP